MSSRLQPLEKLFTPPHTLMKTSNRLIAYGGSRIMLWKRARGEEGESDDREERKILYINITPILLFLFANVPPQGQATRGRSIPF